MTSTAPSGIKKTYGEALKDAGDYLQQLVDAVAKTRREILGLHGRRDSMSSCEWHQQLERFVSQLRYLTREHWMTEGLLHRLVSEPGNESIR